MEAFNVLISVLLNYFSGDKMATYIVISLKNLYNDVMNELKDLQETSVRQAQEDKYKIRQLQSKLEDPKRLSTAYLTSYLHGLQVLYAHIPRDQKIQTIRILRDYLSCTLLETKHIVERVIEKNEKGLRGILYCNSWEEMNSLMGKLQVIKGIRLQVEVL